MRSLNSKEQKLNGTANKYHEPSHKADIIQSGIVPPRTSACGPSLSSNNHDSDSKLSQDQVSFIIFIYYIN